MPQDNNVTNLIINQLTKVQYQELVENNQLSNSELYIITDEFHYTENEIIALLQNKQDVLSNGEGILISDNIISIDLDVLYKKDEIDTLLSSKANISETAYKLVYENNVLTLKNKDDETLSVVELYELPDVDKKTISYNEEGNLQAIGERIKSGTIKYTWIGTQEEYEQAKADNVIDEFTEVLITDSVSETVTPIVQYDAPTKLSDLANDLNFATQDELQEVKNELDAKIEGGIDDSNFVHLIGNETIDGFKNFKQKIVIENGLEKGRIAHKPVGTSLEDGYIEFGDNTLLYGKQNIQGELYDEKHDIFHSGNLVAGDNIIITNSNGVYKINGKAGGGGTGGGTNVLVDNTTITKDSEDVITAVGVKSKNDTILYDWIGTLEEYNQGKEDGTIKSNWMCYITDDNDSAFTPTYGSDVALLDIIVSNQLLEGADLVGKALQGSMVLGSEYPDAYNKLLTNKNRYTSKQVTETIGGVEVTYIQCVVGYKILDISNKDKYDSIFDATGTANFFILDETNKLFYLPKTNNFLQPNTTISEVGEYNEAGLPNITGTFGAEFTQGNFFNRGDGAFGSYRVDNVNVTVPSNSQSQYSQNNMWNFDASRSSSIYSNSDTVQPQSTNVFIYYKIGNTIQADANIDLEVQVLNLQQRNNIPFTLLESKYSEIPLYNTSWLLSNGSWYDGTIYEAVYDKLIGLQENPEEGFSIKLNTEEYDDYDFVLNLDDETFRLPLKTKYKFYKQESVSPVVGNGMVIGLYDGTNLCGAVGKNASGSSGNIGSYETAYGQSVGGFYDGGNVISVNAGIGITTDPTKSGIEAHVSLEEVEDLYLYYYVGDTNKDLNVINTGKLAEKYSRDIDNKLDKSQITNCILEVPQRIKYTLENGTLTIKAGSVVIVPYGTTDRTSEFPVGSTFLHDNFKVVDTQFADGKFFVWVELVGDIIGGFDIQEASINRQIYISVYHNTLSSTLQHISGDNPTTTTSTWTLAYNTSTNLIGRTDNDTVINYDIVGSLPIMHVVSGTVSDGTLQAYASINQVFNGMGYIGSVIWVDKGVKGLIPNGRNEDGSLNNIEYTTPKFITRTLTHTQANDELALNTRNATIARHPHYELRDDNYLYYTTGQKVQGLVVYGNCDVTSGVVSNFKPKQPFRAMDANEVPHIIETYQNGASWYRVYSDGWCEQGGYIAHSATTQTISLLKTMANADYTVFLQAYYNAVPSGTHYFCLGAKTTNAFTKYSVAAGGFTGCYWQACGHIV